MYSWGLNHEGQLGHGGRESLHLPKRVAALRPYRITHVAAGWETCAPSPNPQALLGTPRSVRCGSGRPGRGRRGGARGRG